MAERDRFELDLAAALRAYLDEAPTEVRPTELARQFATAYPHGTTTSGLWRLVAFPRRSWILLVLAGLLAALVGGTLLVGSQMQRRLPAVVPPIGQLFECPPGSTPDKPGPVDQARPPLSSGVRAFDRRSRRIVLVGPTTVEENAGVETWTFDVCTNAWTRAHPNREPPSFDWVRLVYDVDSDATIGVSSGNVWAYNLQANTWTEKRGAPAEAWLSAYDPDSGLVVAGGEGGPWNYDVETDTWSPIQQTNAGPDYPAELAYDASVGRMVGYTWHGNVSHETWLLDIRTGTWSRSDAVTPHVLDWLAPAAIAYDEAARRTVVGGNVQLAAYDATADRWETIALPVAEYPDPDAWFGVSIVYDPVNERLVLFPDTAGQAAGNGTDTGVVAFDVVTREWTVLLEPGEGQLANPSPMAPAPTSP